MSNSNQHQMNFPQKFWRAVVGIEMGCSTFHACGSQRCAGSSHASTVFFGVLKSYSKNTVLFDFLGETLPETYHTTPFCAQNIYIYTHTRMHIHAFISIYLSISTYLLCICEYLILSYLIVLHIYTDIICIYTYMTHIYI